MVSTWRAYLPSNSFLKKIGLLLAILIVCFGIAALVQYLHDRQTQKNLTAAGTFSATPILVKSVTQSDEDANGIPDWIDHLSGGTVTPRDLSDTAGDAPLNETEQFAHDLLATSASISQVAPLSDDGANTIAQQVTDRIAAADGGGETFTIAEIKIVPDSKSNQDAYVAAVTKLLDVTYPLDVDTSISILQDSLSANDQSALAKLAPISDRYGNLIDAFKKLSVPSSFAQNDLDFLNTLGKVRGSIESMRNTFTNPVVTMSTFMNYPAAINDLINFISPFTDKLPYSSLAPATTSDTSLDTNNY